jgi:uncharacterized repeat protein (TIGR03803 family)
MIVVAAGLMMASLAWASSERVLYSFNNNGADGVTPYSSLVFDGSSNLYGTTVLGGSYGCGTVFELSPAGQGWTETVIYSFQNNGKDGCEPYAGLISDAAGNLYGTTYTGGGNGAGAVFELSPAGNGQWREKLLSGFGGSRGAYPIASLTFDSAGNLYGTTVEGGNGTNCRVGCGTVFQLTPVAKGRWTETVLHSFAGAGSDGAWPYSTLIFDASGNLYGTTFTGGQHFSGTVFELTPNDGQWTETILYSFNNNGQDAVAPTAGVVFDSSGNLYGTATAGGISQAGAVFELIPGTSGWTETVLHSFGAGDGSQPYGGLLIGPAGRVYGTTYLGGSNGWGTVFALTKYGQGEWAERVLYSFENNGSDGYGPYLGNLVRDSKGHLYGTTAYGGSGSNCGSIGCGAVVEVIP